MNIRLIILIFGISTAGLQAQYCTVDPITDRDTVVQDNVQQYQSDRHSLIVNHRGKQRLFYLTYRWIYEGRLKKETILDLEVPRELYARLNMYGTKKLQFSLTFQNGQTMLPDVLSTAENTTLTDRFATVQIRFTDNIQVWEDQKMTSFKLISGRQELEFDVFSNTINDKMECLGQALLDHMRSQLFSDPISTLIPEGNTSAAVRQHLLGVWGVLAGQNEQHLDLGLFYEYFVFSPNGQFQYAAAQDGQVGEWYIESDGSLVVTGITAQVEDPENPGTITLTVQCPDLTFERGLMYSAPCSSTIGPHNQLVLKKLKDLPSE